MYAGDPQHRSGAGLYSAVVLWSGHFADAKVQDLCCGFATIRAAGKIHVGRRQVAVHNSRVVGNLKSAGDLGKNYRHAKRRERSIPQEAFFQALAGKQLHYQVGLAGFGLACIKYFDDTGMAQLARGLGLANEAIQRLRVIRQAPSQELNGKIAIGQLVSSPPHLSHPAFSQEPTQTVSLSNQISGVHE